MQQLAQWAVVGLAAAAVFFFVRTAEDAEARRSCSALCQMAPNYAQRNRLAPDFELPTLSGGTLRLSSLRGKQVVMNFWTKTCGPCLEEMPSLAELAQKLAGRADVVVLTVSTDESIEDARGTLRTVLGAEAPFLTVVDPGGEVVGGRYGTKLYPETWFIDARGVIRARVDGARRWSDSLVVNFLEGLSDPLGCAVEFSGGRPQGPLAPLCEELSGA